MPKMKSKSTHTNPFFHVIVIVLLHLGTSIGWSQSALKAKKVPPTSPEQVNSSETKPLEAELETKIGNASSPETDLTLEPKSPSSRIVVRGLLPESAQSISKREPFFKRFNLFQDISSKEIEEARKPAPQHPHIEAEASSFILFRFTWEPQSGPKR